MDCLKCSSLTPQTKTARSFERAASDEPSTLLTCRAERERVVHLHATAAFRLRELDAVDDIGDAARDLGIDARALRRRHVTVRRDEELRRHRAGEARLREQLLLVAVR